MTNNSVKTIIICEVDPEKLDLAEKKLRSMIVEESIEIFVPKHQWQWQDDDKSWKDYDLEVNVEIDKAFSQKHESVIINFPITRANGTHKLDLNSKVMKRLSRFDESKLERKLDGWYADDKPLGQTISEIIDMKSQNGETVFTLFINKYEVNFKDECQINVDTKFKRKIRKLPLEQQNKPSVFQLKNAKIKSTKILSQEEAFLVIEGLSSESVDKALSEITKYFEKHTQEAKFTLSPVLSDQDLALLKTKIDKYHLTVAGELKIGQQVTLRGFKKDLDKIAQMLESMADEGRKLADLPSHWDKISESCRQFLSSLIPWNGKLLKLNLQNHWMPN